MVYRLATLRDAAFLSKLVIGCWRDAYRDFLPWSLLASLDHDPHHDIQSWERRISEPASVTWIIDDTAGNGIGVLRMTIGASSIPDTDSELTSLYLLSQARGQGIGSNALAFGRVETSRRNTRALGVCVLAGNKGGKQFYERLGARLIGDRVAFSWDDQPIIETLYRLD
jgi:GNAT superfamily N-acetyltransferase